MNEKLPEGCYKYIEHKHIIKRDIYKDRPQDQCDISVERVIRHSFELVKKIRKWAIYSTTTYEMSGNYKDTRYMGGRCWAETDFSGLEWRFREKQYAKKFLNRLIYNGYKA